jgi:hypothetical protein
MWQRQMLPVADYIENWTPSSMAPLCSGRCMLKREPLHMHQRRT